MDKINFDGYFGDRENKYYDTKILITILEDLIGADIDTIKKNINESKVNVTAEEVKAYLEKRFIEDEPELWERVRNPKKNRHFGGPINLAKVTQEEIAESAKAFVDDLSSYRYEFESYTLQYFNTYIGIVKRKSGKILNIIINLANKDFVSIQELMTDLDIQLDENDNISKEDIIRLITPMVYNYNDLQEKVAIANNLDTYLTFKLSREQICKVGNFEGELYPREDIITKNGYYDYLPGYIHMTEKQKEEYRKDEKRRVKSMSRHIVDLWD